MDAGTNAAIQAWLRRCNPVAAGEQSGEQALL